MNDRLPRWRRWRRRFWFRVTQVVLGTVGILPVTVGRQVCRGIARLAAATRRRERELARRNLRLVYADQSDAWREQMLRRTVLALGETLYATLTVDMLAARGFPGVSEAPGPDGRGALAALRDLLAKGRGALLVTGHLGCWELLGAWLAHGLDGAAVVTGTVRNPAVDQLLQDRRRALGIEPLARDRGARPVLRALAAGLVVGVLIDQNTGVASAQTPFLGQPAPTPLGPARIARRRGVPLLPAVIVREDTGWVVRHGDPIDPAATSDEYELTAQCNRALEDLIRRNPDQWVWFHDRWNLESEY